MKTGKHIYIAPLLLLGALGGAGLSAQEGYSYAFKARGGLIAGDLQTTHFDNKIISFGAEVRREMLGPGCALTFELAWEYVPGRHHDVRKPIFISDDPEQDWDDNKYNYDTRKEYGQGFSFKFAYNAPFKPFAWAPSDMEWFAGISLDMHSVRTEVEFGIYDTDWDGPYGDSFVEQGSALTPGFFGGLRKKLGDGTACELTLRNFGMKHFEYTPGVYLDNFGPGKGAGKLETGTSRGWSIEFAFSVKI